MTPEWVQSLRALKSASAEALIGMAEFYMSYGGHKFETADRPIHDACVPGYLLVPDAFSYRQCNVVIETRSPETEGMTVVDWWHSTGRPRNCKVLGKVDAPRFFDRMYRAFATLPQHYDTLLVDTAAGLGEQVLQLAAAAAHVLVVLCDEPASLTDAYGLIKVLSRECGVRRFQVLANRVAHGDSGELLFRRLQKVTDRYLDAHLGYAGEVPDDPMLLKAVRAQRAVVNAYPGSPSARALQKLATKVGEWSLPAAGSGRIEFFFERLQAQRERRLQVVK